MPVAAKPFVAVHDRVLSPYELALLDDRRRRLIAGARGVVIDLGGSTGAHFATYEPDLVERVVVVAPDPLLRPVVERRASRARVPIELVDDPSEAGVARGGADTVVSQFVLCAVDDPLATVREARALLAPDGRFRFLEHVPATGGEVALRRLTRPLWRAVHPGCHQGRDVPAIIRSAGYTIIDLVRFSLPTPTLPLRSCAVGVARPSLRKAVA